MPKAGKRRRQRPLHRGWYAPCPRCGQEVVHYKNGQIAHMHWDSNKCRANALPGHC